MPWLIRLLLFKHMCRKRMPQSGLLGQVCPGRPMCSNINLQPPSYSTLPLLTWWEELLLTLICLRFFVQSDFVVHLISEIASDMKGMLARQWCFMLHSISVGSKQSWAMSSGSNLIFEHQLCVRVVYIPIMRHTAIHIFGTQDMPHPLSVFHWFSSASHFTEWSRYGLALSNDQVSDFELKGMWKAGGWR